MPQQNATLRKHIGKIRGPHPLANKGRPVRSPAERPFGTSCARMSWEGINLKRPAQLAVLVVAVMFVAQPLLAASVCWQAVALSAACASRCPLPEESAQTRPAKAKPADPSCCEVSSSNPTPQAVPALGSETLRIPLADVASLERMPQEQGSRTSQIDASSPRPLISPLHSLYCVFLI